MIISRTPLRISFFGGGTDYPAWYNEHGGGVISTSINKFSYLIARYLPPFFEYNYRIRYSITEETKVINDITHPSVRECLKFINLTKGIEVQHNADLPANSGLGSSSAFTVGLLNALFALKGEMLTKRQLATYAIEVEQNMIGEVVGSQDQTAAAFGGLNYVEFGGPHDIAVRPLTIGMERSQYLQSHLMLFFTGFSRIAAHIAHDLVSTIDSKKIELQTLSELTQQALKILNCSGSQYDDFGRLLNESWQVKRRLSQKITSSKIDDIYNTALKAGALGGKLLGAGGGGFFLFYVEPEKQIFVKTALQKLLHVPFNFETLGSQIVYYSPTDDYTTADETIKQDEYNAELIHPHHVK